MRGLALPRSFSCIRCPTTSARRLSSGCSDKKCCGVIEFKTQYVTDPRHGFWLLDNELVRVETYSAELNLRQPQEIELYSRIFERHAAVAGYGTAARAIIGRVMAELAAEVPDEPGS